MLICVTAVKVCDARDDDSSTAAGNKIKKYSAKRIKEQRRKRVERRILHSSLPLFLL